MITKTTRPRDCFSLMKEDHRNVKKLFREMKKSPDKESRTEVFDQVRKELEAHTHMEEHIFYPAIKDQDSTHDLTLEAYEEHHVVKILLKELSKASPDTDEWMAKFEVLTENVEHHIKEEEEDLFPKAKKVLGNRSKELGQEMKDAKDAFLKELEE